MTAVHDDDRSAGLPGLALMVRRWTWIVAGALAGLVTGLVLGQSTGPTYESTVYLTVSSPVDQDAGAAARAAQGLARLATGPGLVGEPLAAAGLDWSAAQIRSHVTVQAAPDAPLVSITGIGDTPQEAQVVADVVGRALADVQSLGSFTAQVAAAAPLPGEALVPTWVVPAGGLGLGVAVGTVLAAVLPGTAVGRRP